MSIVRYLIQKTPIGTIMKPNAEGNWVGASDFDRVYAELDALHLQLNSTGEHNDRLIAAINKVRETVCLPASIEAILISALDRKEKTDEQ